VCALERRGACSRGSLSGPPWWAVGATVAWAMPRVFKWDMFGLGFLQVLSGFPQLFKGTPRAVPDSSPRASAGSPAMLPQMLEPTHRTSSPLACECFPWGRVSGPAGLAPEAL
jgi:hypothetical protein